MCVFVCACVTHIWLARLYSSHKCKVESTAALTSLPCFYWTFWKSFCHTETINAWLASSPERLKRIRESIHLFFYDFTLYAILLNRIWYNSLKEEHCWYPWVDLFHFFIQWSTVPVMTWENMEADHSANGLSWMRYSCMVSIFKYV